MAAIDAQIRTDEHGFIAGGTGSGKSRLARAYLSQFQKVTMLDTKGDSSREIRKGNSPWPEVDPKTLIVVDTLQGVKENWRYPKIIYEPAPEELNPDAYNEFFKWQYDHENLVTWVDEVMSVCPNAMSIPFYYQAILTRGRSKECVSWGLSQRPSGIPSLIMDMATHYFGFRLSRPDDRKTMALRTEAQEFLNNPGDAKHPYNFWYSRQGTGYATKAVLVYT